MVPFIFLVNYLKNNLKFVDISSNSSYLYIINKNLYMASAKQRYTQLMEWLAVRKQNSGSNTPGVQKTPQRFSKADSYNKVRK